MSDPKILLIIPCYNEGSSIKNVLRECKNLGDNYHTLVIDDGSQDNTLEVVEPLSRVIRLEKNHGIGIAMKVGIQHAVKEKYDFCIQIDGDGQHPPEEAKRLVESYNKKPANLIIGSRYLQKSQYSSGWLRVFGTWVISILIFLLFGKRVHDTTSGMRMMDKTAMDFFAEHYPVLFPEPISISQLLKNNMLVTEVQVEMRPRIHGTSSIGGFKSLWYMIYVMYQIVLVRIR